MARGAPPCRSWTRRQALALATLATPPLVLSAAPAQERGPVLIVSRRRLLNETRQARALREAEQRMTAELQGRIDETKRQLAAEEQELAELRSSLPRDQFEARTSAFDRKIRSERREAQRQAAALQTAFRSLRVSLLETVETVLERVRAERGASVILDRDEALASDPALDITDDVIARLNTSVPLPEIPDLETLLAEGASERE